MQVAATLCMHCHVQEQKQKQLQWCSLIVTAYESINPIKLTILGYNDFFNGHYNDVPSRHHNINSILVLTGR